MRCDWCGTAFADGDEVVREQSGEWVGERGFLPTEQESVHHEECPEVDEP